MKKVITDYMKNDKEILVVFDKEFYRDDLEKILS